MKVYRTLLESQVKVFLFLFYFRYEIVADINNASRELSLHPVHLVPDTEGNLPPSALILFCSYQEDSSLLGQERSELGNLTLCDKFKPFILEGQLCYSLDLGLEKKRKSTKAGQKNGLYLLLDPSPYEISSGSKKNNKIERNEQDTFKVYIHTLAQYTAFGPGNYAMSTLKKMTSKKSTTSRPTEELLCTRPRRVSD